MGRVVFGDGGGGVLIGALGPETNVFGTTTTADKAAAAVLRDTYATANPAWLADYNAHRRFFILLQWTGGQEQLQRRNVAGTAWEDVTGIIVGPKGAPGTDGLPGLPGVSDGVLSSAPFDDATYLAALGLTIGADVILDLSPILATITALTTRVAALEIPIPHTGRRYCALLPDGNTAADFTAPDFLAPAATFSDTQDVDTPDSSSDAIVGLAVPAARGPLTQVSELDANGNPNPLASMLRTLFAPAIGDTEITLDINGVAHYVYASIYVHFASILGIVGYRLKQTPP